MEISLRDPFVQIKLDEINEVLVSPPRSTQRRRVIKSMAKAMGKSERTVRRHLFQFSSGGFYLLGLSRQIKRRSDAGRFRKFPAELQKKAREILSVTERITSRQLHNRLMRLVTRATLNRWLRLNYDRLGGVWLPINVTQEMRSGERERLAISLRTNLA